MRSNREGPGGPTSVAPAENSIASNANGCCCSESAYADADRVGTGHGCRRGIHARAVDASARPAAINRPGQRRLGCHWFAELIEGGRAERILRVLCHRRRPGVDGDARNRLADGDVDLEVVDRPPLSVIVARKV